MADAAVSRISQNVNGPLMKVLAEKAGYHDVDAIKLFCAGAPVTGTLVRQVSLFYPYSLGALDACLCACIGPESART